MEYFFQNDVVIKIKVNISWNLADTSLGILEIPVG